MDKKAKTIIIIGAGGHGRVVLDILLKSGREVAGFLDDDKTGEVLGYPVLGKVDGVESMAQQAKFVAALGDNVKREQLYREYNLEWVSAIHPSAVISDSAVIEQGAVVMAGAIINPLAHIGKGSIINTGAIVEHDCKIGDFVHVSPGVTMGGTCEIGERSHIGIGATLKNNITVAADVIVGAGAVVVKDIVRQGTYIGVPALKMN